MASVATQQRLHPVWQGVGVGVEGGGVGGGGEQQRRNLKPGRAGQAAGGGSLQPPCWARKGRVSPGRDIGGKVGTLVGIHKLGCSRYIFPLGLVSPTYNSSSRTGLGATFRSQA